MNAAQLRTWMLPKPRPTSLRVRMGKTADVIPCAGQSWSALAKTVEAMQADVVEALNDDGLLIRAIRPNDIDDDDKEPEEEPKPPLSAYDPETVRFELFAKLLSEAYAHSNTTAFDKLVAIADVGARRAEALEKTMATYDRMRRQELEQKIEQYEGQIEAAGGDGNLLTQMAQQFFAGAGTGKPTAPPTTTNGKGH